MIRLDGPPDLLARQQLEFQITRLEALIGDLRSLAAGSMPNADQLAGAPVLHAWQIITRPVPCLAGMGLGHPRLPPGPVVTTDLWAVDATAGWARTLSRFYRLKTPLQFQRGLEINDEE
ncbi:DUF6634 family protein [Roseomonas sp. WA12]